MNTGLVKNIVFLGVGIMIAGCTTLHTAASKGNVRAIERLVKEEANIDETDASGKTPLMYAVMLNQKESLDALLKAGADVNTQSETGNTALHEAILQGNYKFGALLLDKGANVAILNKEGKNALNLAKEKGNQSFIDLILSHGAVPTLKAAETRLPEPPASCAVDATIEPIPVIVHPAEPVKVEVAPKVVPSEEAKPLNPTLSKEEMLGRLRKMIAGRETMGIRNFLNQYPQAIELIDDPMQRIRYVGPSGFRVIDIIENMGRGKMKEADVINQIISTNLPYKMFSADDIKMLNRYGISNPIIDAMVKVSK